MRIRSIAAVAGLSVTLGLGAVVPADATSIYTNCTAMHTKYPHGVGKKGAHDRVRGHTKPVTTFVRNTKVYNAAMRVNDDLDRDRDGVACEKR